MALTHICGFLSFSWALRICWVRVLTGITYKVHKINEIEKAFKGAGSSSTPRTGVKPGPSRIVTSFVQECEKFPKKLARQDKFLEELVVAGMSTKEK